MNVEKEKAIQDAVWLLRQLPERYGYTDQAGDAHCDDENGLHARLMHHDADEILLELLDTLAPEVSKEWRRLDEMAAHFWYS